MVQTDPLIRMLSSFVSLGVESDDRIAGTHRREMPRAVRLEALEANLARLFRLAVGGLFMAGDLTSAELKDPFSRAMKRAVEPPDVWTPRRLLALQLFACGGLVYSTWCGGLSQPLGVALFFGSAITLGVCRELKGLLLRIERLEADGMLRDLGSHPPQPAPGRNPLDSMENRAADN